MRTRLEGRRHRSDFGRYTLPGSPDDAGSSDKIGMQRKWFQSFAKAKRPHYDISETKRQLAIKCGAVEVDSYSLVELCKRILADKEIWLADPEYHWQLRQFEHDRGTVRSV
jgi:hypothetical protein